MGPINYLQGMPQSGDLLRSIQGGLQVGSQIQQMQFQREDRARLLQQEQAQQQAQQQAQAQYQTDLQAAMAAPSAKSFAALAVKYPQHREAYKQAWDTLGADRQQAELRDVGTLAAALQAGKPDVALARLDERIGVMQKAGEDTAELTMIRDIVKQDPTKALGSVLNVVSRLPGGDKLLENLGKVGAEERAAALAPGALRKIEADATKAEEDAKTARVEAAFAERAQQAGLAVSDAQRRNLMSQIGERSKRLRLDQERFAAELAERMGTLPTARLDDASRKVVADAAINATAQTQGAEQLESLASRLDAAGVGNGAFSWIAERTKGALGWQGEISSLRNEYARVRNSLAIKSLPPGPATDKDIELALRGFPSEFADGSQIAGFLRGMAKLQRIDAEVSNARAEWVSTFRTQAAARDSATIAGLPVTKGQTFDALASAISARAQAPSRSTSPEGKTDSGATFSGWNSTQ